MNKLYIVLDNCCFLSDPFLFFILLSSVQQETTIPRISQPPASFQPVKSREDGQGLGEGSPEEEKSQSIFPFTSPSLCLL
jgi:hypothetical protein